MSYIHELSWISWVGSVLIPQLNLFPEQDRYVALIWTFQGDSVIIRNDYVANKIGLMFVS